MNAEASDNHSRWAICPRCNAGIFRVSRRLVDLFVSIFVPIRRYRCRSLSCGWEGNIREKRLHPLDLGQDHQYEDSKYHLLESSRTGCAYPPVRPPK